MLETLVAKITGEVVVYASGGVVAVALAWMLKRVPNDVIQAKIGLYMFKLGTVVTLGLGRWKITRRYWQGTIEPWAIDLVENIVVTGISQFVAGMRSDNPSKKKK